MNNINNMAPCENVSFLSGLGNKPFSMGATLFNTMEEIWRDVPDFSGKYMISNLGNVKSLERIVCVLDGKHKTIRDRILKKHLNSKGYYRVNLSIKNNKIFRPLVHRLVAEAFIPREPNKNIINHKNCIRTDNRVENLEWCDYGYNYEHAILNGLKKVRPVVKLDINMNIICVYPSVGFAHKDLGVKKSHIEDVANGKRKKYHGFIWRWWVFTNL